MSCKTKDQYLIFSQVINFQDSLGHHSCWFALENILWFHLFIIWHTWRFHSFRQKPKKDCRHSGKALRQSPHTRLTLEPSDTGSRSRLSRDSFIATCSTEIPYAAHEKYSVPWTSSVHLLQEPPREGRTGRGSVFTDAFCLCAFRSSFHEASRKDKCSHWE